MSINRHNILIKNNFLLKGTQEDKDRLGYQAIVKLHENMDDDRDGQVEINETKEVTHLQRFIFINNSLVGLILALMSFQNS